MEQRDYFQRQIDQLGKAIAHALSILMKTGYSGDASLKMEIIDQMLKDNLNMDMMILIDRENGSFIEHLIEDLQVSPSNFENLAETMLIYAQENKSKNIYEKALLLFEYIKEHSSDFSFDRELKITEVKKKLAE